MEFFGRDNTKIGALFAYNAMSPRFNGFQYTLSNLSGAFRNPTNLCLRAAWVHFNDFGFPRYRYIVMRQPAQYPVDRCTKGDFAVTSKLNGFGHLWLG